MSFFPVGFVAVVGFMSRGVSIFLLGVASLACIAFTYEGARAQERDQETAQESVNSNSDSDSATSEQRDERSLESGAGEAGAQEDGLYFGDDSPELASIDFENPLTAAIVGAYRTSPVVLSGLGQIETARARLRSSIQNRYVRFSGSGRGEGTVVWSRSGRVNGPFTETSTPLQLALGVRGTKPLYDRSRDVDVKQSQQSLVAQSVALDDGVRDLIVRVIRAYSAIYYNIQVEGLYANAVVGLERLLDSANERFKAGQITRVEVAEAEATLASQRSELVSARNTINTSINLLEQLSNTPHRDYDLFVEPVLEGIPVITDVEQAVDYALERNYGIRIGLENVELARLAVERAEADRYVKFNLVGEVSQTVPVRPHTGTFSTNFSLGVESTFSFFDGGLGNSAVQSALLSHQIALSNLRNARDDAERNARSNYETLISASARVDAAKSEVQSYEIALEGVEEAESAGIQSLTDVLEATRRLILSNVRLINTRFDHLAQRVEALSNMGVFGVAYIDDWSGGLIDVPNPGSQDGQYLKSSAVDWDNNDFRSHKIPAPLERGGRGANPSASSSTSKE